MCCCHIATVAAAPTRLAFEQDPEAFLEKVRPDQEALTAKLVEARKRLNKCVAGFGAALCSGLHL